MSGVPELIEQRLKRLEGVEMAASEVRRSVEELAQALYESRDPSGIPWVKRGQAVRDPWLHVARQQIAEGKNSSEGDGEVGSCSFG